ncbi:MAG TPA: hypothetical protein VIK12_06075, partial [Pengzhenrongella sp.]
MPRPTGFARVGAAAAALTIGTLAVLGGAASAALAGTTPMAPVGRATANPASTPIVVVGTTGLRWDDVGALTTPALWDLSRSGSVGTVSARSLGTSACPADGWLAVSAGERASDLAGANFGECRTLREPGSDGLVPGWADYLESATEADYAARPGLLGDTLASAGVTATGIGPGAAIALADSSGRPVGEHLQRPRGADDLTARVGAALKTSRLVVVD